MQIKKIQTPKISVKSGLGFIQKISFNPRLFYIISLLILLLFCVCLTLKWHNKYQTIYKLDSDIRRYSENIIVEEANKEKFEKLLNFLSNATSTETNAINIASPFLHPPSELEEKRASSTPTSTEKTY